jgi:hypothetical protein
MCSGFYVTHNRGFCLPLVNMVINFRIQNNYVNLTEQLSACKEISFMDVQVCHEFTSSLLL